MGRRRGSAPRLWRVGLYIRLSREDGRTESLSVQNQRKILMDYLKEEFQGPWELEASPAPTTAGRASSA